jgi:hypothetical protein
MFLGIVVCMYYDDHAPPHFHALYEGVEAEFGVDGRLYRGAFPPRARRLVHEWARRHQRELAENWERAERDRPLAWIEPLQ